MCIEKKERWVGREEYGAERGHARVFHRFFHRLQQFQTAYESLRSLRAQGFSDNRARVRDRTVHREARGNCHGFKTSTDKE